MKYGIQLLKADGSIEYVWSNGGTSSGPNLTDDITETALFAREKSAIEQVITHRKYGFEDPNEEFQVIEIEYAVQRTIKIPKPTAKTGIVLILDGNYFTGPKNPKRIDWSYSTYFENKERATIFKSVSEATARKKTLIEGAQTYVDFHQKELDRYPYPSDHWRTKQNVDSHKRAIETVERLKTITVGNI